jgi:hypothetical protein
MIYLTYWYISYVLKHISSLIKGQFKKINKLDLFVYTITPCSYLENKSLRHEMKFYFEKRSSASYINYAKTLNIGHLYKYMYYNSTKATNSSENLTYIYIQIQQTLKESEKDIQYCEKYLLALKS